MRLTKFNDLIEGGDTVEGDWQLTPDHEVRYKKKAKEEEVRFKGSIVAFEPGALLISVTEKQEDQRVTTRIVKLTGTWKTDSQNRIQFDVERQRGKNNRLCFTGSWAVGDNHEIVYSYTEKGRTRLQSITISGYWDVSEKNRLTYYVGADTSQAFRFRGAFQTQSIFAKENELRYQFGVEVDGKRTLKTITLFGKWKMSRKLGLSFEIEYAGGRKRAIEFGAEYHLDKNHGLVAAVRSTDDDPLGVEVIFTRDFVQSEGQAFLRLYRSIEESRAEAGARFRW